MNNEDLILQLLKDFRDETNRRFEQNEQILREFRDETNRRFEQIDKRFEQVDKRFEQLDRRLERMEDNQESEKKRLDEVYESRHEVKVTFGWQWGMISLFIAIVAAGITKIFA